MQRSRFLTSRVGRNGKDRVVTGDLYKHDRLMQASWNVVDMFVQYMFFFLQSKRSGSSDTCVAGDTMLDGPALVKLALQVEPRRPRRQARSK